MLTVLKTNRSLTFYQPTSFPQKNTPTSSHSGSLASAAVANTSMVIGNITTGYNSQLNGFLNSLNAERDRLTQKVADGLAKNASYDGARNDGVKLTWKYEKADVDMGGKGLGSYSKTELEELKQAGKVRDYEGHHINDVHSNLNEQANPDNVTMLKEERKNPNGVHDHKDAHDGDWKNQSKGDLLDRDAKLKNTNIKRVFKNELRGLGIAAAIGAGIGLTIGFAVTLAQAGVSPESLKLALAEGAKTGTEAGVMSVVSYGIGRTIGQIATKALAGLLENLGVTITDNITKMCGMGVIGSMTIVLFSAYQFIKLKRQGVATRIALIQIGKQALFALSLLAVSIAAQGILGGPAGIIASVSIGIIMISYTLVDTVHQRRFAEKIRVYMIDKCRPVFAK